MDHQQCFCPLDCWSPPQRPACEGCCPQKAPSLWAALGDAMASTGGHIQHSSALLRALHPSALQRWLPWGIPGASSRPLCVTSLQTADQPSSPPSPPPSRQRAWIQRGLGRALQERSTHRSTHRAHRGAGASSAGGCLFPPPWQELSRSLRSLALSLRPHQKPAHQHFTGADAIGVQGCSSRGNSQLPGGEMLLLLLLLG